MRGPLFVGALEDRFIAARVANAGPELIRDDGGGDAAKILHGVAVALNEVRTALGVCRLDVRVIRGAQHGDKQLAGPHDPGRSRDRRANPHAYATAPCQRTYERDDPRR